MQEQRLAFGQFLLNPGNGTLLRRGELVPIGRRGARLLEVLLKRQGEVLTKAELMDAAWPGTAVEESNLSVQIALLRKIASSLGDAAFSTLSANSGTLTRPARFRSADATYQLSRQL